MIRPLPERIERPQDIEDIFDFFEHAANEYVRLRLKFGEEAPKRVFRHPNDVRWTTDALFTELCDTLGHPHEEMQRSHPMRWALNSLRDFVETITKIRKVLDLPNVQKKDDMAFYYFLADDIGHVIDVMKDVRAAIARTGGDRSPSREAK